MAMIEHDWKARAACRVLPHQQADSLFFVGQGGKASRARKFCANSQCPVARSCYNYAVLYEEEGFWAGTTKADRDCAPAELKEALRKEAIHYNRLEIRDIDYYIKLVTEGLPENVPNVVQNGSRSIFAGKVKTQVEDIFSSLDTILNDLNFSV